MIKRCHDELEEEVASRHASHERRMIASVKIIESIKKYGIEHICHACRSKYDDVDAVIDTVYLPGGGIIRSQTGKITLKGAFVPRFY